MKDIMSNRYIRPINLGAKCTLSKNDKDYKLEIPFTISGMHDSSGYVNASVSGIDINDEMKVLYGLGAKYTDLLLYSSYNAFKFYGLDKRFGTVEKGKYADLVIMDDELNVKDVYIKGERVDA